MTTYFWPHDFLDPASAQLRGEWWQTCHLICFLLRERKTSYLERFPSFYVHSICFQMLPPFLFWMALIPFPPEVNGTSLNKFSKETTKCNIHPEKKPHDATLFFCSSHTALQPMKKCQISFFHPHHSPLSYFLFLLLPLSVSAEANGCFRPKLSSEALWPQFNHHTEPNSSSCFYFSEHGPEALK